MNWRAMVLAAVVAGVSGMVAAKLPPPSEEQKAKAAEAKAKADEANKKAAEQLNKSMDQAAERYQKGAKTAKAEPAKAEPAKAKK